MAEYKTVLNKETGEMKRVAINEPYFSSAAPISADDMASLDAMTREQLIALVRRIGGARWAEIITMTRNEQAIAMKDRLAHIALTAEVKEALIAIDKFLDREEGRARQQIELTGKDGSPLSVRLLAIQERYLPKDITPPIIEN